MKGFIEFIKEQGVLGLAIGFLLGGSVTTLTKAFVEDIVNPLLGVILNNTDELAEATLTIGQSEILWGHFLTTVIDFLIIALVVYLGYRLFKIEPKKK
jgi:large conductance mechanosensitive channel